MIAYLTGTVKYHRKNSLIIVVGNIGYSVAVPVRIATSNPPGNDVELYTHQYVREDSIDLFGFSTIAELELFEQLISVSGIGPKAGLALLSQFTAEALQQSIMSGDTSLLTKVPGIGKKTAERLILELKGSLAEQVVTTQSSNELVEALQQLGYSNQEILAVIKELDAALGIEDQIKAALALLSK